MSGDSCRRQPVEGGALLPGTRACRRDSLEVRALPLSLPAEPLAHSAESWRVDPKCADSRKGHRRYSNFARASLPGLWMDHALLQYLEKARPLLRALFSLSSLVESDFFPLQCR